RHRSARAKPRGTRSAQGNGPRRFALPDRRPNQSTSARRGGACARDTGNRSHDDRAGAVIAAGSHPSIVRCAGRVATRVGVRSLLNADDRLRSPFGEQLALRPLAVPEGLDNLPVAYSHEVDAAIGLVVVDAPTDDRPIA